MTASRRMYGIISGNRLWPQSTAPCVWAVNGRAVPSLPRIVAGVGCVALPCPGSCLTCPSAGSLYLIGTWVPAPTRLHCRFRNRKSVF